MAGNYGTGSIILRPELISMKIIYGTGYFQSIFFFNWFTTESIIIDNMYIYKNTYFCVGHLCVLTNWG